jgi:hypothetical protein
VRLYLELHHRFTKNRGKKSERLRGSEWDDETIIEHAMQNFERRTSWVRRWFKQLLQSRSISPQNRNLFPQTEQKLCQDILDDVPDEEFLNNLWCFNLNSREFSQVVTAGALNVDSSKRPSRVGVI